MRRLGLRGVVTTALAALMIPLVALGAAMSRLAPGATMRPGQLLSAAATYGFLAAALITLGIGSVQFRRWARALTLIVSWYWLLMGALITVLLAFAPSPPPRSVLDSRLMPYMLDASNVLAALTPREVKDAFWDTKEKVKKAWSDRSTPDHTAETPKVRHE